MQWIAPSEKCGECGAGKGPWDGADQLRANSECFSASITASESRAGMAMLRVLGIDAGRHQALHPLPARNEWERTEERGSP